MAGKIITGDCRDVLPTLPDESVHCVVTSPPYWGLRDYGVEGQLGLEATPQEFVDTMVAIFREVRRVLRDDGTLWLNLGDSYSQSGRGGDKADSLHQKQATNAGSATVGRGSKLHAGLHEAARHAGAVSRAWSGKAPEGLKPKDLVGIPWRVAFALQADGWYLRQDIIWSKPNPMPESVRDRCTKAHEYIFLLSKSERYYFDAAAIAEPCVTGDNRSSYTDPRDEATKPNLGKGPRKQRKPSGWVTGVGAHGTIHRDGRAQEIEHTETDGTTRNKRSVWTVSTKPFKGSHFATFPPALIEPCILAGSKPGDVVLDPFGGSGTTGQVAENLGRKWLLIELNPEYADLCKARTSQTGLVFMHMSDDFP
jgi:DNA modification methylase